MAWLADMKNGFNPFYASPVLSMMVRAIVGNAEDIYKKKKGEII